MARHADTYYGAQTTTLLAAADTTGAGAAAVPNSSLLTFQATLSDTTTPAATIDIEFSNNGVQYVAGVTIGLSGALDTEIVQVEAGYKYVRANVTAISGTDATATVVMGW